MAESNYDAADVLMNRGLNFAGGYGGFGGYGGGRGGHGNFHGDGSAVNANVVANRDITLASAVNKNTVDGFLSAQIATAAEAGQSAQDRSDRFLANQMNSQHDTLSRQISDNRLEDRFNALTALIVANDKSSVQRDFDLQSQQKDCCCALKAGQATIIANQEAHAMQSLRDENNRLQIIINNQTRGG